MGTALRRLSGKRCGLVRRRCLCAPAERRRARALDAYYVQPPLACEAGTAGVLLIPFRLGAAHYAVAAAAVQLVLPLPRLQPVPEAAPWMRGVFLFHGAVMPVLDLCRLTSGQSCSERLSSRLLLVGSRENASTVPAVALLAEDLTRAVRADTVELAQPDRGLSGPEYAGPWVAIEGQLVQVIAWQSLVTPEVRALYGTALVLDR